MELSMQKKIKDIIVGPPHMEDSWWYLLIASFMVVWMWMIL